MSEQMYLLTYLNLAGTLTADLLLTVVQGALALATAPDNGGLKEASDG